MTNSGVLGHLFGDRSKIAKMLEPLKTGVTMGTETIKLKDEEIDVTEAIIDHMVDQIELARKKQFATAAPGTPQQAMARCRSNSPKASGPSASRSSRPPRSRGHHRSFPVHLISGAEEVLARMVGEKETTNLFTPVRLGEVLAQRNLTPSKQVNPWARHDDNMSGVLSLDASGSLVKKEKYVPEPQKVLTFIDAIDAVRWAMIFCRWGEEHVVNQFAEFFTNMVRDNPNKLPQVREYYRKCSWELAMHMRKQWLLRGGGPADHLQPREARRPLHAGCHPTAKARARAKRARAKRVRGSKVARPLAS